MTFVLALLKDWRVLISIALIVSFGVWLALHDRAVIERHQAKVEAKAAPARAQADEQRVKDAIINTKTEQELHHAIDTAPTGGAISHAAHALACQRLRNIGRIPPACRPEGGDGTQARTR